jgi:hypothetical protein
MDKLGKTPKAEHQQTPRKMPKRWRESCTSTSEETDTDNRTEPKKKKKKR